MSDRFTDRACKVMQLADDEARRLNHEYVGTEHILLGLIKEGSGVAAVVLRNLNVELHIIRQEIETIVQSGPDPVTMEKLPQTPRAKKVLEYAVEEARILGYKYVNSEHLLLGLLREVVGIAYQVLQNLGLGRERICEELFNLGVRPTPRAIPNPLLIATHDENSDLPSEVRQALAELKVQVEQLDKEALAAALEPNYEKCAALRYQSYQLTTSKKPAILREWPLVYPIDPSWFAWNDGTVAKIVRSITAERRWEDLPILADALEEAGCTHREMLNHCREGLRHGSSCWVVNLLRGSAIVSRPVR